MSYKRFLTALLISAAIGLSAGAKDAIILTGNSGTTDLRRTGYPKIFPVLNPGDGDGSLEYGDIIRRIKLPGSGTAEGLNDIFTSGLNALGGKDLMSTRVFWYIDSPNF